MPADVYYPGNPITATLRLGRTPGPDTVVTVSVSRPGDRAAIAAPVITAWAGEEKTATFYATDDGLAAGTTAQAVGDWLAVWTVVGTGAQVVPQVYPVAALPGAGTRPTWSPFLSDVAKHVMRLSLDRLSPGVEVPLGTFTATTDPTDQQAQRHIDDAVDSIVARLGGTVGAGSAPLASVVASLRAAAAIARGHARSDSDIRTADALDHRADVEMAALIEVDAITSPPGEPGGTGTDAGARETGVPYWDFPPPPAWADIDL